MRVARNRARNESKLDSRLCRERTMSRMRKAAASGETTRAVNTQLQKTGATFTLKRPEGRSLAPEFVDSRAMPCLSRFAYVHSYMPKAHECEKDWGQSCTAGRKPSQAQCRKTASHAEIYNYVRRKSAIAFRNYRLVFLFSLHQFLLFVSRFLCHCSIGTVK